ncbi:L2 [Capra hircus papillomavirus 1]|uniref:Minor capsid protein L2 n=1 Tax=Capra hircus papillomavirus 1 TaxID=338903 RepID=Q1I122_9PAPI|nr:L2 [Capra hircus papillomavirus 1]AAZ39806.1 L2 [Capra hircus papillomavirus 1]
MVRAKRVKRASEDQLYRDCLAGRECKPDIKDKYENNTLADSILKWASQFLWFGQLGIGTGRGSGGSGGYTRLGGGGGGSRTGVISRPPVVIDSIGPRDITPIDTVDPTASSIVPLNEGGPSVPTGEIEVIAETTPTTSNGALDPVIVGEPDLGPATIDVSSDPTPSNPVLNTTVSSSIHNNPSFDAAILSSQLPGEFSVPDQVVITHGLVGEHIGAFENIELDTIGEYSGFGELEVEEPPSSSTPQTGLSARLSKNLKQLRQRLYNRRIQQRLVENQPFLTSPRRLVQFEYSNPSFQDEVSLEFERDINTVVEAPHYDFRDVVRLGRPESNLTDSGHVRVSRLGTLGTISTRSGLIIGGQVHYYTDLSSIAADTIELPSYQPAMSPSTIVHIDSAGETFNDMETSFCNVDQGIEEVERDLLDSASEDFSNSRLLLSTGSDIVDSGLDLQDIFQRPNLGEDSITVNFPTSNSIQVFNGSGAGSSIPATPIGPLGPVPIPAVLFNVLSSDLLLDPSLLRKRRKKYGVFS